MIAAPRAESRSSLTRPSRALRVRRTQSSRSSFASAADSVEPLTPRWRASAVAVTASLSSMCERIAESRADSPRGDERARRWRVWQAR